MKNLIKFLVLGFFGTSCATNQKFYVKESENLNTVMVKECSTITFKDYDTGEIAKKKACFERSLSSEEKTKYIKELKGRADGKSYQRAAPIAAGNSED